TTMSRAGYQVLTAQDDREALALVTEPVDLVISDATSESQTRSETLRRLQAAGPELRIAATIKAATPDQLKAADLFGAQTVFTRPLSTASVAKRVKALLQPRNVPYVEPEEPMTIPARGRILR
ncbi:MAG: hypothetical protein ABI824_05690, partial [Acidobacteriota bacterium]